MFQKMQTNECMNCKLTVWDWYHNWQGGNSCLHHRSGIL